MLMAAVIIIQDRFLIYVCQQRTTIFDWQQYCFCL